MKFKKTGITALVLSTFIGSANCKTENNYATLIIYPLIQNHHDKAVSQFKSEEYQLARINAKLCLREYDSYLDIIENEYPKLFSKNKSAMNLVEECKEIYNFSYEKNSN